MPKPPLERSNALFTGLRETSAGRQISVKKTFSVYTRNACIHDLNRSQSNDGFSAKTRSPSATLVFEIKPPTGVVALAPDPPFE